MSNPTDTSPMMELPASGLQLTQVKKGQALLVLLSHVFMPFLVLTALVSASTGTTQEFMQVMTLAGFETAFMVLVYSLSLHRFEIRMPHAVSVLFHLALTAYWFYGLRDSGSLYALATAYVVILLLRFHHTDRSHSLSASNQSAFVIDTIAIFLVSLYYYAWAVPIGGKIPNEAKPLFVLLLLGGVLLRVFELWRVERLEFESDGSPAWLTWGLLSAGLLAVVAAHNWILKVVQIVTEGVISLLGPFLKHFPFPVFHFQYHEIKLPNLTSAVAQIPQKKDDHYLITPAMITWFYGVVIAVLIVILLVGLLRKQKDAVAHRGTSREQSPQIIRRSLTEMEYNRFVRTKDPIRLKVQGWLRKQLKQGAPITDKHSIRMMVAESEPSGSELQSLVDEYERIRYGERSSEANCEIHSDE